MGHYRGEMVSDEEAEKEEAEKQKRHLKLAQYISRDIKKRGLESVLADILADPTLYKIHGGG